MCLCLRHSVLSLPQRVNAPLRKLTHDGAPLSAPTVLLERGLMVMSRMLSTTATLYYPLSCVDGTLSAPGNLTQPSQLMPHIPSQLPHLPPLTRGLLTRTRMKDYLNNSPGSSSPSNMSGSGQLPCEEEEKPDVSGAQVISQPKVKTDPTQTPIQTPLLTPPDRVGLQDPIDLVSHVNRHSTQGQETGVSQLSPQLQPQDPQTLGMGFQYGGPPYLYDQSLGEFERPELSVISAIMASPGCRAAPKAPRLTGGTRANIPSQLRIWPYRKRGTAVTPVSPQWHHIWLPQRRCQVPCHGVRNGRAVVGLHALDRGPGSPDINDAGDLAHPDLASRCAHRAA